MKTVYGPVPSWRLGRSLGVDPVCRAKKTCSFDCLYCQLGPTVEKTAKREVFVEVSKFRNDLKDILSRSNADIVTFSGTSEPTLASNLGDMANMAKELTKLPMAILTNSSLIQEKSVREDLRKFDVVVAKLDAPNGKVFSRVNKPVEGIAFGKIVDGLEKFRDKFIGKLALQMMFIEKNRDYASEMVEVARKLDPDEVQINTPLRPCPVKPLDRNEIESIESYFSEFDTVSVYKSEKPKVLVDNISETIKRRPKI